MVKQASSGNRQKEPKHEKIQLSADMVTAVYTPPLWEAFEEVALKIICPTSDP